MSAKSVKSWLSCAAAVGLALAAGCRQNAGTLDATERAEPMMQKAMEQTRAGDVQGAVRTYHEVLDRHPDMARAHLDLALLLHDHLKDHIVAVYHYQRYLELRPEAEKKSMIENRIRLAKQALAASLVGQEAGAPLQVAQLEKENLLLKSQVAELTRQLELTRRPAGTRLDAPAAPAATTPRPRQPAPPAAGPRRYTVRSGDSLRSIAIAAYGNGDRWKEIWSANRVALKDANRLVVGQTLVIP